jgi:rhodanese-related sulfurtransferase
MVSRRRLVIGAVVLLVVAAVVAPVAVFETRGGSGAASQLLSPPDFARVVSTPGVVTINVLGPGAPSIDGTDLMIPADLLVARSGALPEGSTQLAVYCWSGHTSARAVRILHDMGYSRIAELRGGMQAWQAAGLPLAGATG